jgi:hypothetical protein
MSGVDSATLPHAEKSATNVRTIALRLFTWRGRSN